MKNLLASLSVAAILCACAATLSDEDNQAMVEKHNYYRAQVSPAASDMKKMTYDASLADVAQSWAEQCEWSHNPDRSSSYPGYVGENLFLSTAESVDYPSAVTSWYNENVDYDFDSNSCAAGKVCGHYTQVVWANSEKVGCGAKRCSTVQGLPSQFNNALIIVCDYSPGGNVAGATPYTQGAFCSQCSTGYSCVGNLCAKNTLLDILMKSERFEEGPEKSEVLVAVL